MRVAREHPIGFIANKKCDRRDAGGNYAAIIFAAIFESGGVRRETSPADSSSEAKLIENFWIVIGDARGKNVAFPGVGGSFETLKLANDFERAALAENLRAVCGVLPAQQPAHELRLGSGFDFGAESAESKR